ncbi:hypothetical protein [Pseudomonas lurida]|uniref:hypothetical protein n=1 Tax=Pseudomonas lurida TaxID=244566 RepID=UPI0034D954F3
MFQGALRGQKAACLAGKYVSRSLAVHAGFEKFCIPRGTAEKGNFATLGESLGVTAHLLNRVEQRKMQDA